MSLTRESIYVDWKAAETKYMRTEEIAFNKAKRDQGRGGDILGSAIGKAIFLIFLNKLERRQYLLFSPSHHKNPEQLKLTDDKIIYSCSKSENWKEFQMKHTRPGQGAN